MEEKRRRPVPGKPGETLPSTHYILGRAAPGRLYTWIPMFLGFVLAVVGNEPIVALVGIALSQVWWLNREAKQLRDHLSEVTYALHFAEAWVEKLLGHPIGEPPKSDSPKDSDPKDPNSSLRPWPDPEKGVYRDPF